MNLRAWTLAAGLAVTSGAHAVNTLNLTDSKYLGAYGAPTLYLDTFAVTTDGPINHSLGFDITEPLYAGSGIADVSLALQFGNFTLTIKDITGLNAKIYDDSNNLYASFSPVGGNPDLLALPLGTFFAQGHYTLAVGGTATGLLGGTYAIAAATVPVPEPKTWAMLLAGIGLIGLAAWKRSKNSRQPVFA